MAKRRATEQIRKDQASEADSSSDEENVAQQAAPEILASRKIAVPRTRRSLQPSLSVGGTNPFGSLNQASSISSGAANPFGFLGGNSQTGLMKPDTSGSKQTPGHDLKIRGLNASFAAQISKANSDSPFEDWSLMCEKYLNYAKSIGGASSASTGASTGTTTGASTGATTGASSGVTTAAFNNSASSKPSAAPNDAPNEKSNKPKSQITASGFKFGGSIPTNSSSFTFGDKTVDLSKSHSSKPSGGFVFNPNGPGEIKAAPSSDTSMMNDANFDDNEAERKDDSKSAFSFSAETKGVKPSIFGSAMSGAGESKPAFSFGAANSSKQDETEAPKPFSFGKPSATEGDVKPAPFSFEKPTTDSKEKESSGPTKTSFSFGSQLKSDSESKPAFSFGKQTAASSAGTGESNSGSLFAFGKGSSDAEKPKPFTFGNSSTGSSTPAFSFGSGNTTGSSNTAEKPKFNFGPTATLGSSGFTFGTGSNPFASKQNESSKDADSKTSDTARLDASWNPSHPVKINTVTGAGNTNASAEAGESGEPSEEQNEPQTNLGGPGPGEEDENSAYEKKSKIFEQVDGEYKALGLGMLRVLVHKTTKKARILVRAEGSGRVLLNVPVRKEFTYKPIGKGQVRVMDIKAGSDTPTTYLLRVKTEEDGNELAAKLEEVKA